MARFARDIIGCMNDLTKKLEVSLGPDTGMYFKQSNRLDNCGRLILHILVSRLIGDLSLRVGLHSGPVTAGVSELGSMSAYIPCKNKVSPSPSAPFRYYEVKNLDSNCSETQ